MNLLPWLRCYTVSFVKANNEAANDYVSTWKNTSDNLKFTIANGNNYKGTWDYVKFGTKSASTGTITTDKPFAEAIAESTIKIDDVKSAYINSIKLLVSTSADFTTDTTTSYDVKVAIGEQTTKIKTPVANAYYRYVIDCKQSKKNGSIQISKITFTTVAE